MLAVGARSGLASDLVALSGSKLASVEINLPVLSDKADHLVIRGWDGFHAMEPGTSQDGIKRGQIFNHGK